MGFVGVNYEVSIPGIDLFFADIYLHGGPAPVRRFLPDLIQLIWVLWLCSPGASYVVGPLTDPTAEVSLAAVVAQPVPVRTTRAPFVRFNLPDPFEHAQAVRLRAAHEGHREPGRAVVHLDPVPVLEVLRLELQVVHDDEEVRGRHLVEVPEPRIRVRLVRGDDHDFVSGANATTLPWPRVSQLDCPSL